MKLKYKHHKHICKIRNPFLHFRPEMQSNQKVCKFFEGATNNVFNKTLCVAFSKKTSKVIHPPTFRPTPFHPTGCDPKLFVHSYQVRLGLDEKLWTKSRWTKSRSTIYSWSSWFRKWFLPHRPSPACWLNSLRSTAIC